MLECTTQSRQKDLCVCVCVLSLLTGGRVSSVAWPVPSVSLCSGAVAQPAGHAWPAPPLP